MTRVDQAGCWWDLPEWVDDPNAWAVACEEVAGWLGEVGPVSDLLSAPPGSVRVIGRTPEGRVLYLRLLAPSEPEEPGTRPVVAGDVSAYLARLDLVSDRLPPPPPPDTVHD